MTMIPSREENEAAPLIVNADKAQEESSKNRRGEAAFTHTRVPFIQSILVPCAGGRSHGADGGRALQTGLICALWLLAGISNSFPTVAIKIYQIRVLKATPSVQQSMNVLSSFGWNLKLLVAFVSDCVPICYYRRRPYLVLGLVSYMVSYFALSATASVGSATFLLFLATLGQMAIGTMCDTLVVENMRDEAKEEKGRLQTRCWVLMTLGGVIGSIAGGYAVDKDDSASVFGVFWVNACLKIPMLFIAVLIHEQRWGCEGKDEKCEKLPSMRARFASMKSSLKQSAIWKSVIFIFLYGLFPSQGIAMTNFLVNKMNFRPSDLGWINVIAGISGAVGMALYYKCFRNVRWSKFFTIVIVLCSLLSLTQLLLVEGVVPEKYALPFAFSDDAVLDIAKSLLSMPILILIASLTPLGVEGSVYALATSVQMNASTISAALSALLISAFGITQTAFSGFAGLISLCAFLRLLAIPALALLPPEGLAAKTTPDADAPSKGPAIIFVLLIAGVSAALVQSIVAIS